MHKTSKVPKEYECPVCHGSGEMCDHPEYDEDHCPDDLDECDHPCTHIVDCTYCKGEGMVTFAKMNRPAKKMAAIVWGINKPKAGAPGTGMGDP